MCEELFGPVLTLHVYDSEKFDEILLGRLRGAVSAEDFKRTLSLSKKDSGLGFLMHTTEHVATKVELILGSGV